MDDYNYPPVPLPTEKLGKWIRTLDILPGRFGSELRLSLRCGNLDDKPRYHALSYTWGLSSEKRSVVVNENDRLPVTDNLYRALQRLRRKRSLRTVWIDALCINQADLAERSEQVAFMCDIYRTASCVYIWLGEPSRPLPQWTQLVKDAFSVLRYLRYHPRDIRHPRITGAACTSLLKGRHYALESAINSTIPLWYERIWTVQEHLMAADSRLLFGSNDWTVLDFQYAYWILRFNRNEDFVHLENLNKRLHTKGKDPAWAGHRVDLLSRFRTIAGSQASDKRDLIYGLLGIIAAPESQLIGVNYSLPFSIVCARATFASLHARRDFAMLRSVRVDNRSGYTAGIPSWAVDFAEANGLARNIGYRYYRTPRSLSELPRFREPKPVELNLSSTKLSISGVKCGNIVATRSLGSPWHARDLLVWMRDAFDEHFGKDQDAAPRAMLSQVLKGWKSALTDFARSTWPRWQSLAVNLPPAIGMQEAECAQLQECGFALEGGLLFWYDLVHFSHTAGEGTRRVDLWHRKPEVLDEWISEIPTRKVFEVSAAQRCYTHNQNKLEGFSLFMLGNGLVGIARSTIAVGDIIMAQPYQNAGASCFLVLRSRFPGHKSPYTFQGLAWVHGWMTLSEATWQKWNEAEERWHCEVVWEALSEEVVII